MERFGDIGGRIFHDDGLPLPFPGRARSVLRVKRLTEHAFGVIVAADEEVQVTSRGVNALDALIKRFQARLTLLIQCGF